MSTTPSCQDPNLPQGDSAETIQRMMLCDSSVNLGGLHIPALFVAVIGGVLVQMLISYLIRKIISVSSTEIDFFMGIIRFAGILLISYAIQRFVGIRNMYPGLWPCGFKPSQLDPTAQAVNKVLYKLGGVKGAACKLGGLSSLAQSVGGLPVLIKSSGGLACLIDEYGTFPEFVCAMGGMSALEQQLPNAADLYRAMGGGSSSCSCSATAMPMDNSNN